MKNVHPMQPVAPDNNGVPRFKQNKIVHDLLRSVVQPNLNAIAMNGYSIEDQEQFAQLIGYSVNGFGELSYVRDETIARIGLDDGRDTANAEIAKLTTRLERIRAVLNGESEDDDG